MHTTYCRTGLYAESHGIIANVRTVFSKHCFSWTEHSFPQDFYDPQYRFTFNPGASESR
jgi:hypothetical protein